MAKAETVVYLVQKQTTKICFTSSMAQRVAQFFCAANRKELGYLSIKKGTTNKED